MTLEDKLNKENIVKTRKKPFLKSFLLATSLLAFPPELQTETYKSQAPESTNYETIVNENEIHNNNDMFSYNIKAVTTPKWTIQGRVDRAIRFKDIFEEKEKMYNTPANLLPGLMMQESYGLEAALNSTGDGGAGIMQFQPGTARSLGLKVYGDSYRTGRDFNHGRALRELVEKHDGNIDILGAIDERFDPEKAIDAAASYLSHLHDRFGTWEGAVSAYRRGRPASDPMSTHDVKSVYKFQDAYTKRLSTLPISK